MTGAAIGLGGGDDSGADVRTVGDTAGRRSVSMGCGWLVVSGVGTGGGPTGISLPGSDKRNRRRRMPTIGIERDPITLRLSARGLWRVQDSQKFRATSRIQPFLSVVL